MAKRLNDTQEVAAMPAFGRNPENKDVSVSVRPIENGFIKRTSVCDEHGYRSTEVFTPSSPDPSPDKAGNAMETAMTYLKENDTLGPKGGA